MIEGHCRKCGKDSPSLYEKDDEWLCLECSTKSKCYTPLPEPEESLEADTGDSMTRLRDDNQDGALIERGMLSVRTVASLMGAMVVCSLGIGSFIVSVKLDVANQTADVRRVVTKLDEVSRAVDSISDMKAEMKLLFSAQEKLEARVNELRNAK